VVREAQQSTRVIDADNIDEMADDILAEEEADDLLEGGPVWLAPRLVGLAVQRSARGCAAAVWRGGCWAGTAAERCVHACLPLVTSGLLPA
jgi:hypothetical protein